jgi:hypothetical protein
MEDMRYLGIAHKLAVALLLVSSLCPNTTGGKQWMVQAQPTPADLTQPLPVSAAQTPSDAQNKPEQPHPVRRLSPVETIRKHMQRLGYSIDESKSKPDMIVSNYSDPKKGKVTIAMVYDKRKEVVSFYIYNFGNVGKAADPGALHQYLLAANDAIIIGGFFVDHEGDIGYKYASAAGQLSMGSFEVIYETMAGVALDRRPEIRKLIESGKKDEGQKDNTAS